MTTTEQPTSIYIVRSLLRAALKAIDCVEYGPNAPIEKSAPFTLGVAEQAIKLASEELGKVEWQ